MKQQLLCAVMVASLVVPAYGHAQRPLVHGRLLDDATRQPISAASVHLLTADGLHVATALSDTLGRFRISPNVAGEYTLRAERIGYRTAESKGLKILDGDTIGVDVWLSTAAVLLAPLEVTATARHWNDRYRPAGLDPFYERMRWFRPLGGLFYTRADLRELEGLPMSTVLATLGRGRTDQAGNVYLRMGCRPQYFLNGSPFRLDDGIDRTFATADFEAVEIYRSPGELPGEFSGTRGHCAIVLWTRRS